MSQRTEFWESNRERGAVLVRRRRKSRGQLLKWMLEHPTVWEGYSKTFEPPLKSHERRIWEALQGAGMFSRATGFSEMTVSNLVRQARFARNLEAKEALEML